MPDKMISRNKIRLLFLILLFSYVSLVTGALINGTQLQTRLHPGPLIPGEVYDLAFDLHFTTWTFHPGHRIQLAVSNVLFPMIWPTPYPMMTKLYLESEKTRLELPLIPEKDYKTPSFKPPEPIEESKALKPVQWICTRPLTSTPMPKISMSKSSNPYSRIV